MKLYVLVNNRSDDKSHLSVYYVAVLCALGLPAAYEYIDRWGIFSVNGQKKEIGRPFYIDYDNKIVWLAPTYPTLIHLF